MTNISAFYDVKKGRKHLTKEETQMYSFCQSCDSKKGCQSSDSMQDRRSCLGRMKDIYDKKIAEASPEEVEALKKEYNDMIGHCKGCFEGRSGVAQQRVKDYKERLAKTSSKKERDAIKKELSSLPIIASVDPLYKDKQIEFDYDNFRKAFDRFGDAVDSTRPYNIFRFDFKPKVDKTDQDMKNPADLKIKEVHRDKLEKLKLFDKVREEALKGCDKNITCTKDLDYVNKMTLESMLNTEANNSDDKDQKKKKSETK